MRTMLVLLAAGLMVLAVPGPATAVTFGSQHPYDDKPHGTALCTSGYAGYAYACGTHVFCVPNYNFFGYPPWQGSPKCIAADVNDGTVQIVADTLHGFTHLRGWCMTAAPFANPNGIKITVSGPLGSNSVTCKSNYGANKQFDIDCASIICFNVDMRDTANFWGFDHLFFTSIL